MRTLHADIKTPLNALFQSKALVWLIAIELKGPSNQAFYLTNHSKHVTTNLPDANGIRAKRTWMAYPMEIGEFPDSGTGDLPRTTLALANSPGFIMPILESGAWDQARVTFILVWLQDLSLDIGLRIPFAIQGVVAKDDVITLSLGPANFFDRPFPPQRYIRSDGFPAIPRYRP